MGGLKLSQLSGQPCSGEAVCCKCIEVVVCTRQTLLLTPRTAGEPHAPRWRRLSPACLCPSLVQGESCFWQAAERCSYVAGDPLRSIPRCTGQRADPRRASLHRWHAAAPGQRGSRDSADRKAGLQRGLGPSSRVTAQSGTSSRWRGSVQSCSCCKAWGIRQSRLNALLCLLAGGASRLCR